MITSTTSQRADQFTATDRCDRCGARAQARVDLVSGDLLFCLHHFHKHRAKLEAIAVFSPIVATSSSD